MKRVYTTRRRSKENNGTLFSIEENLLPLTDFSAFFAN